ncbi:hypothetical protein AMTR_s00156p00056880 [Amborella trichopoda]|uniref:Uncharacterized protein n=1 Tax=Amborella trichopoda TaxID=13333 RepID=W1PEE2_AMBTC|nr:hypothetical protein AMTR_s00156p00056880 [Amborella trichopoda]
MGFSFQCSQKPSLSSFSSLLRKPSLLLLACHFSSLRRPSLPLLAHHFSLLRKPSLLLLARHFSMSPKLAEALKLVEWISSLTHARAC